jgi:large subunit ribosomal protein L4
LKLDGQTCLVATKGVDAGGYKSGRNIAGVEVLPAGDLNAYALLRRKRLLLTREAFDAIVGEAKRPAAAGA